MNSVEKATETQLRNIQQKTGKTLVELASFIKNSGLTKHGDIRTMLMDELGLGYGDATVLAHTVSKMEQERQAQAEGAAPVNVLDEIYSGAKASLRPIHDRLMESIQGFGDFEVSPKKGYVSLRRKRQFVMVGPATNTRIEVGLNHKTLSPHPRLIEQPAASMCNFKVKLTQAGDVDDELIGWIKQAYDNAG